MSTKLLPEFWAGTAIPPRMLTIQAKVNGKSHNEDARARRDALDPN
jgi:hypothetical protein